VWEADFVVILMVISGDQANVFDVDEAGVFDFLVALDETQKCFIFALW
jgi:hypothetical protein